MEQTSTVAELFAENERKDLLRLLTAGSVDDGKSTLIGRLLFDSKTVYEDTLSSLKKDSERSGSRSGDIDYALLLDGLKAEREQGITIDVAYRYFSTPKRKFIIADSPGHEQYTRNMVTGGSTADMAVLLIDAQHGVLPQTKRHSFITSLLGIKHIVIAINKMDAVDYKEEVFEKIKSDYSDFAAKLDIQDIEFIPISAYEGDNVVEESENMPWYQGPTMLNHLENVHVASDKNLIDLRFPVQYVLRPTSDFRGYSGTVASGIIREGEEVMVLPSGRRTHVKSIVSYDGSLKEAYPPMAVTVTLEDELDVSRGDMLVHVNNVPRVERRFDAMLVWMAEKPLKVNGSYVVKQTTNTASATIANLRYKIDVNTLHREDAEGHLDMNEIGRAAISLHAPLYFDPYMENQATGSFVLIDRITNDTVAAGMILKQEPNELVVEPEETSRPVSQDVHPRESQISLDDRLARMKQKPATVWLTGLPKSGKSTVAYALEKRLFDMGYYVHVLDGENMRLSVSSDLGFSGNDRAENIRRGAEVARLCNDIGLITIAAFVSPYSAGREHARESVGEDRFKEVYLDTPMDVCEQRDNENLYKRAKEGEIQAFSGVTAPYEPPQDADLQLSPAEMDVEEEVEKIVELLRQEQVIS